MKNKTIIILIIIVFAFLSLSLFGCSSNNGTYYQLIDGKIDKNNAVIINGNKWEISSQNGIGVKGDYTLDGDKITLYVDLAGQKTEYLSGTLSNGVLKLSIAGTEQIYYKDGIVTDADTDQPGGNIDKPLRQYVVSFNSLGGTSVSSVQTNSNSLVKKPAAPFRDGYVFIGWYKDKDFKIKWDFNVDKVTEDITLYAKWGVASDLSYELNADGESYAVVGVNTDDTDIIIPDTYNNKSVTVISSIYDSDITSIFIPDSITTINEIAFYTCDRLKEVNVPDSVTDIGMGAFVTCFSLEKLTVDNTNPIYHSYGNCIIETASKTLIAGCKTSVIPDDGSVTKIKYAFAHSGMSEFVIPKSVTEIGDAAFFCSGLTRVTIPENVISIADNAFDGCEHLVEVCNKSKLDIVEGSDTFGKIAENAKNVYTPTSGQSNIIDDDGLIFYCDETDTDFLAYEGNATDVVLPQNFNGREYTINQLAFSFNSNLKTLTIPDFLVDLNILECEPYLNKFFILTRETHPLYTSKEGVIFNKNGTELIKVSKGIENLSIPNNVVAIGENAFYRCSSLTSVIIPDSVISIGEYAFSFCSSLESITISSSVTSIGQYAFYGCSSLANVNYLGAIEDWCKIDGLDNLMNYGTGNKTFSLNGQVVTELVIPDTVTSIPYYAFANTNITSVTISDSVTSIGAHANLAEIQFTGTVAQWNEITTWNWNDGCRVQKVICTDGEADI